MLLITCGVCDLRCKLRADVLSRGAPRRFGAELKTLVMHLKKRYCLHNNVIIHIFIKVQNRSVSMGFNYAYQVVLPGQPGFLSMLPGGRGKARKQPWETRFPHPYLMLLPSCPVAALEPSAPSRNAIFSHTPLSWGCSNQLVVLQFIYSSSLLVN